MSQVAEMVKKPLPAELLETIGVACLDETACRDWLLQYLHTDHFTCPACNQEITSDRQREAFQAGKRVCCKACSRWFDNRSGTVLAATTLTPRQIILLALLIAIGLPAREISERLGLHESTVRDWRDRLSLPGGRFTASIVTG